MLFINFLTASDIATQMYYASKLIEISYNKSISFDNRTTLVVNSKAQKANKQMIELAKQFNEAFQIAFKNIQSAAEEFQQKDHEIAAKILQSTRISEYLKDLKTYTEAKNG